MAGNQHQIRNLAALTPLESQIYELQRQGLNVRKISDALGGKWTPSNVSSRLTVIREKIACASAGNT